MNQKHHKESRYEKECKALRKKGKRRVRLYSFALICVVAICLVLSYTLVLKPAKCYETALNHMTEGNWQEALSGFKSLGTFRESNRLAAFSECMSLFQSRQLNEAAEAYLSLNEADQTEVQTRLGTFTALAESSVDEGRYTDAYIYYSLDLGNPERDDVMYAISVYNDSQKLIEEKRYAEARSEIIACLEVNNELSAPLQTLLDSSYACEFNYYDSFTVCDLAFAVSGMETLVDEYEPAHIYLRDLRSAYYGGVLSMQEGKYSEAIKQFEDISAYSDTAQKLDECRVLLANQQAEAGDTQVALKTVELVKNWQDYLSLLPEDSSLSGLLATKTHTEDADDLPV